MQAAGVFGVAMFLLHGGMPLLTARCIAVPQNEHAGAGVFGAEMFLLHDGMPLLTVRCFPQNENAGGCVLGVEMFLLCDGMPLLTIRCRSPKLNTQAPECLAWRCSCCTTARCC